MAIYVIQGKVKSKRNGLPVPYANIEVLKVGTDFSVEMIANGTSVIDGGFNISFDFALPGRPNIIFRISQNIAGVVKYIYNENPAEDARLNIGDVLYVNINVEEDCITSNTPAGGVPYDQLFVFTRVGVIGTGYIDQSDGYAEPPGSIDSNVPFGRTLDIAGWFGMFCDVEYYQVQYSSDGITWKDITDPLYNNWYDVANGQWVTEVMGPAEVAGVPNLYKLPNRSMPWTFPDLITHWDTTKVLNGPVTLRILGKKMMSGSIFDAEYLTTDPSYGTLKLQIDNTPPKCNITDVYKDNVVVNECGKIEFIAGTTINVKFEAKDEAGHLARYSLNAYYGHNHIVVPVPMLPSKAVDDYSQHIDPITKKWIGSSSYTIDYPASEYDSIEMPTCAYQLRLRVDKRTSNGYGEVYWGYEDTVHLMILR